MFWTTALVLAALTFSQVSAELLDTGVVNEDVITAASGDSSRISGGWPAVQGQFPYGVLLDVTPSFPAFFHNCGGSIVHREWVLTTGICVRNGRNVFVRAGFLNRHQPPPVFNEASEIFYHPSFNTSLASDFQWANLALLKMKVPFVYSRLVQRVKLQPAADAYAQYAGMTLTASGWGSMWTNDHSLTTFLQFVQLHDAGYRLCELVYGVDKIFATHLCARWSMNTNQNICYGDRGGPLVHVGTDGVPVLVGVAAFSGGCQNEHPSGFIRPGAFHGWLTQVTGLDFENLQEGD